MKTAIGCLTTDELKKLLHRDLPDRRLHECIEHLDSCATCQENLEEVATGGTNLSDVIEKLDAAQPLATSAFWPALREFTVETGVDLPKSESTGAFAKKTTQRIKETALDFLLPATDPAYLGRLAHFDVMRILGRGGMGVVLEAFDSKLQRHVAIKVLDGEVSEDETGRHRFCREARAAASVSHENVVAVYQVERICEEGRPYIVMQLVAGDTLEERLSREKKLPIQEVIRISMQAARGLAAAHAQNLIHRDIKPANILLEPPTECVKLTDFGLARVTEDVKLTRTGMIAGTPLYMSPEQAMGKDADQRSDLFSLGAVMYEMLAGQTPFSGPSALAILKNIVETKHPPLRDVNPDVPEWLAELVDDLLAKKPGDRYQTATDLAEVLDFHWARFSNRTVQLPAVCQIEVRKQKFRRRVTLAAVAAGCLILGTIAGLFVPRNSGVPANAPPPAATTLLSLSSDAGPVWSIAADPSGNHFAMGVEDGSIRLWDWKSKSVKATLSGHRGIVWQAQFSGDGETLITAGEDGQVKLWNTSQAEPSQVYELGSAVRAAAISPDGADIFAASLDGTLRRWAPNRMQPLAEGKHPGAVYTLALSPDKKTLATGGSDRTIRLWNAETLTQRIPLAGHMGPIYDLAFNQDGTRLASVGWGKKILLWDVASGEVVQSWEDKDGDLSAVAFSPDGKRLATAGQGGSVRVWDATTGELKSEHITPSTALSYVGFDAEGRIISGGRDGAIYREPGK